jgi:RNA polymerase sporulation-specific sigma factor
MEIETSTETNEEVLSEFDNLSDEDIVFSIKDNDDKQALDYIINKYKNFVRAKARSYFLIGADREDIIQEGMIGLYKAIRDFRNDKLSSFRAFAELCVTRQIITAIKTATRQKHIPLNSYVSLNKPIYDEDSDRTLLDVLSGVRVSDPEELIISREEFVDIAEKMESILSDLEWKVLMGYLDGHSYQEIAVDLDRHVKSIDNALQRVKRKIEKYMEARGNDVDLSMIYKGLTTINRRLNNNDDDLI